MLNIEIPRFYKVKGTQTLREIAETFCVSERVLATANGLTAPPSAGQILEIPAVRGNLYTVREGDSKALLCGSEENFTKKNGGAFYLGMRAVL